MNNYSKALKHIDITDVKKKHQRKIISQKLQEEEERKENEHIQSILEVEKYDWRKDFDDEILHIQHSSTKPKVLKSETNEKIIEKENCQLEEKNYIDPLLLLRKNISDVKIDAVVNEQNLKNLEKSLQKNCNDLNDFKDTFFETSSKVLKDVQEIEESVEELQSQYESQYKIISNSSIETKKSLEVVEGYVHSIKEQVFDEIQKLPINDIQKDFKIITKEFKNSKNHLQIVDQYIKNHHQDIEVLKEEVFTEIKNLPIGNLEEHIERLEKKIDFIRETYSRIEPEVVVKEVIQEGLLNDPPETKNSDTLTPLNQNFVTIDQLQEHYRLFINRIQQQLSTIGGGGETRLQYLDDIVGIATNASEYDGKFLKYDHSIGKFEFVTVSGGGSGDYVSTAGIATYATTAGISTTSQGLTGSPNIVVGIVTSDISIPTQLRTKSVAEKTTLVSGNTVGLAFTTGGGNVAICTSPSGDITLNVTSIPTDSTFDNHSISFSVIVTQTGTARTCTAVNLNGVSRTIHWSGKSLANAISGVTTSNGYDIFTFTGINTVGSASTTANYVVLGSVNGGFAV